MAFIWPQRKPKSSIFFLSATIAKPQPLLFLKEGADLFSIAVLQHVSD